jgi:hypothetical protein
VIKRAGDAVHAAARSSVDAALGRAEPEIERRANQIDFAVASTIDRHRTRLLKPRRGVESLTRRLEAHVDVLDEMSREVPPEAAKELDARKGHATWLLNELRRSV